MTEEFSELLPRTMGSNSTKLAKGHTYNSGDVGSDNNYAHKCIMSYKSGHINQFIRRGPGVT